MAHDNASHGSHGTSHYVKVWLILLGLFLVSVAGPMIGVRWITLITAFGIAVIKAHKVAAEFMHLKVEKRIATLIMLSMVVVMVIFFFGVAPDVMKSSGTRWMKKPVAEPTGIIEEPGEHGEAGAAKKD
jgi:caa(3)-type oxidase subunit IV